MKGIFGLDKKTVYWLGRLVSEGEMPKEAEGKRTAKVLRRLEAAPYPRRSGSAEDYSKGMSLRKIHQDLFKARVADLADWLR